MQASEDWWGGGGFVLTGRVEQGAGQVQFLDVQSSALGDNNTVAHNFFDESPPGARRESCLG